MLDLPWIPEGQNGIIMQSLEHRSPNGYSNGHAQMQKVRLVFLLANKLDCDSLSVVFGKHPNVEILATIADLDFGLSRCERLRPQLLILDPKIAPDAVSRAAELTRQRHIQNLLVLDDLLREGRLNKILSMPAVSYFTRQAGVDALLAASLRIATTGERMFDPSLQERLSETASGMRLKQLADTPAISSLTPRELEVMEHLASGLTVRDCAKLMQLAESTIDNHKSRLMKKLNIHKSVELTHLAIQSGLIVL